MKRYFDEIELGEVTESREEFLSKQAIIDYASQFDPQPMHLDDEAAKETLFGTLVASGWHMASLTMRLVVDSKPFGDTPLIGGTVKELKFSKKVLPDITVFSRATVSAKNERAGREFSFIELTVETLDKETGDQLLQQKWDMVVPNRL